MRGTALAQPKPIRLERVREYALPLARVWHLLAHTDRLHQMARLSSVQYGPHPMERDRFSLSAWVPLVPKRLLRWREHPYDWVRNRSFCVLREFESGPLLRYVRGVVIEPTERGTRVRTYVEMTPRWSFLAPWVRLRGTRWLRSIHQYCSAFFLNWSERGRYLFPRRAHEFVKLLGWERHLRRFAAAAEGSGIVLIRLKQHLIHGTDEEVTHMRPKDLADSWDASEASVIRLFLYAASEGLLSLEWTVLCPRCRWPAASFAKLEQVPQKAHCDRCTAGFPVDFDQALDLRFSVNPEVRRVHTTSLYRPEPAVMPHVWMQRFLPPGESVELFTEWGEEKFLCRTLRTHHLCHLTPTQRPAPRPTKVKLIFNGSGWAAEGVLFRPGRQEIEISNRSPFPIVVSLEDAEGDSGALTGRNAVLHAEFRNLFPREAPGPGLRFPVSQVTFLAVSVRDCTDFIANRGDKAGLTEVHGYLAAVAGIVGRCEGSLVRIMGDTVLASFSDAGRAVAAAFQIIESPEANRIDERGIPLFQLNMAVHSGPALLLSRGGHMDFFGESVHRTFQILKESRGGDVVLSQQAFEAAGVQQELLGRAFEQENRELFRNGPSGGFRVCQIQPAPREWKKASAS